MLAAMLATFYSNKLVQKLQGSKVGLIHFSVLEANTYCKHHENGEHS
jgi:hypothetical protein